MKLRLAQYADQLILLSLGVLSYILFFDRLGGLGLVGPDEPRYSAVARQMWLSMDFITPRLNGVPWFEKPPLLYWLGAWSFGLSGHADWATRLPSAIAATSVVFTIYACGRRLYDRTTGLIAAAVLATSAGFFAFARAASMDMLLTACLTVGWCLFLVALNETRNARLRRLCFYGFYVALGFGVLAKGPVAFALPAITLVLFLLIRGNRMEWKKWHPEGILLGLAVALPWYIACTWVNGREFLDVFLVNHNLQRFTTTVHGHQRPLYFYLPVLIFLTFPWTFLLIPALRRRLARTEQLLLVWASVVVVFFSLAGSKLPGYVLPAVPPLALLIARSFDPKLSNHVRLPSIIQASLLLFVGVAFGFFGTMLNVDPFASPTIVFIICAVLAVAVATLGIAFRARTYLAFNMLAIVLLVLFTTHVVFPTADQSESMRPWSRELNQIAGSGESVILFKPDRWMEYGLQYYMADRSETTHTLEDLAKAVSLKRRLCLATDQALEELSQTPGIEIEVVHTIRNQSAFWAWKTP